VGSEQMLLLQSIFWRNHNPSSFPKTQNLGVPEAPDLCPDTRCETGHLPSLTYVRTQGVKLDIL
jgi:hypothetical protein